MENNEISSISGGAIWYGDFDSDPSRFVTIAKYELCPKLSPNPFFWVGKALGVIHRNVCDSLFRTFTGYYSVSSFNGTI